MIDLRRKIDSFLYDWHKREGHKPLIVKGARQIGKTYSIKEFAQKTYESVVSLNFILPPHFGLNGVWSCFPICDCVSAVIAGCMLYWQLKHIKNMPAPPISAQ